MKMPTKKTEPLAKAIAWACREAWKHMTPKKTCMEFIIGPGWEIDDVPLGEWKVTLERID